MRKAQSVWHCGVNNLSHTQTHTHVARQAQQSSCHVALSEVSFHCCSFFIQHATFSFEFYAPSAASHGSGSGTKSNAYAPYTVHREPSHILFSFPSATIDVAQLNLIRRPTVATSASTPAAAVVAFSFAYSTTFFSLFSAVLARSSLLGFLTFARPRHLHLFLPQREEEKNEDEATHNFLQFGKRTEECTHCYCCNVLHVNHAKTIAATRACACSICRNEPTTSHGSWYHLARWFFCYRVQI